MSKIEMFAAIRRDSREGVSGRTLALRYGVSRNTVAEALTSAVSTPRKKAARRPSRLDPFKPAIDDILRTDLSAPRKQRHMIRRTYARLIDEHGLRDVSYQVVRAYVADRKPEIRAEVGKGPATVFFPQTHRPGAEAEVDFGEVVINLRGTPVTCMLFAFRLSFSGKTVHRIFASGGQEAFLEGHVHAFNALGGVPVDHEWAGLMRQRWIRREGAPPSAHLQVSSLAFLVDLGWWAPRTPCEWLIPEYAAGLVLRFKRPLLTCQDRLRLRDGRRCTVAPR
ncbi:transposase [Krasilnikovia cinnamomea]|nr:transposase [Krasilnikovia cinnamomea]